MKLAPHLTAAVCAFALASAFVAGTSLPAQAQNPAVREFLFHCQDDRGWCEDRIEAARSIAVVQGACIPEQMTPDRVTTAVVDWLQHHPVELSEDEEAGSILVTAMKGEWPCGR